MTLYPNDQSQSDSKQSGFDARSEPTTLIAAFSDQLKARSALERLMQMGFRDSEAWLVENAAAATAASDLGSERSTTPTPAHEKHGFTAFIDRMFGFDDETPQLETSHRQVSNESERYVSNAYQNNQHLLVVSATPVRIQEARSLLVEEGAIIDEQANEHLARDFQETLTMRLSEEELIAHKEQVASGEVVLRKQVVTEMKTIEVPVSHEEVVIERRLLDGHEATPTTGGIAAISNSPEEEEIHLTLMEEQVSIEKKLVPKEEISLTKRQVNDMKTVSEEVRREEAKVERSTTPPAQKSRDVKGANVDHPNV